MFSHCSWSLGDEPELLALGELTAPARKGARLGFASMLLQFEESQQRVSQRGHDKSARALADSGGVFAQADIPAVMGAIFTGTPVVADGLEQLAGAVLLGGGAGAVEGVFFGGVDDFAPPQLLALAPHGK